MRRYLVSPVLLLAFAGMPIVVGCDETVSETKKVEVKDDGTVKKEKTTVTEGTDGTVTKTEEKKVDKP